MTQEEVMKYNSKCTNVENYSLSYVGSYGITVWDHTTGEFIDFYWHECYDLWDHVDRICGYNSEVQL